jgi:hypothetical protein
MRPKETLPPKKSAVKKTSKKTLGEDAMPPVRERERTVPLPETKTFIKGYPQKLFLFKMKASPYWYMRLYADKQIIRKSTQTENLKEAITKCKDFYDETIYRQRNSLPLVNNQNFEICAKELILEQSKMIDSGQRSNKLNLNDEQKLKKDILPFFKGVSVKDVNYKLLCAFADTLHERKLKEPTIKNYLNLVHKILSLAQRENILQQLPQFPKIKRVDNPRGWFATEQYNHLKETTAILIKKKTVVRGYVITDEMRHLITFIVNTFLRPNDIKLLKHRNIQITKDGKYNFLSIQTEKSKTMNSPVVSMGFAVDIYKDLIEHHNLCENPVTPNDYVFFPKLKNRDYAMQTMRRQFDFILGKSNLKISQSGERRTLYSLRHTAIMFRLTKGDDIDLLTLARNCRTSVSMLERFYAKPLSPQMNVSKIQSMRRSVNFNESDAPEKQRKKVTKKSIKTTRTDF